MRFRDQLKLVLKRQVTLFVRDPVLVRARMMQCIIFGLIIGGLWFQLGTDLDDTRCVPGYPCLWEALCSYGKFMTAGRTVTAGRTKRVLEGTEIARKCSL
jgi:hypothetical protein